MSLRFIYGKSGTGKTTFCFQSVKELINTEQKIYIITPEQFSFTAEKKLMETLESKAVINAEVITFNRIAYRILNEVGGVTRQHITNCGKAMLLSYMMQQQKENLNFLGKTDKNLDLMLRMITELKKNNITNSLLEQKIKEIENKRLKLKLQDIQLLYNAFNQVVENNYLDEDDLLTIIQEKIKESKMFQDAILYIDEFAGFTKQEYSMIEQLLMVAKQVNVTVCTDSLEKSTTQENDLFYTNKKTVLKLKEIALKRKIAILEPIALNQPYRYQNEELKYLSENLYAMHHKIYQKNCKAINLFLANNNYSEIEYVANNIVELVREEGYQYKDISIITRETESDASLIKSIFKKYQIPVFIDEKKDLNQNIFVKYMIALLEIFANSWKIEAVLNYIKSGFLPEISDEDIYLFENYCKKMGITGIKKLTEEWSISTDAQEDMKRLNTIREKIVTPLLNFKEMLGSNKTVSDLSKSLYTFLEENHIKEILIDKINIFNETGEIELANLYHSSWELFIHLLDELVLVLGKEKISFENYTNLLKVGFQYSSLGKIPATLDEVIVGDVDRTRNSKKKVIFIIGLNDGKFPSMNTNEGFLNDEERIYLQEKGIELAKTTKEQIYDENFNIYKAFSVAEEKLYLSYIATDSEGRGLRRSILIKKIKKIFPQLIEESDVIHSKTYLSSKEITFDFLLLNLRKYLSGEDIDPIWFEVYTIYQQDKFYQEKLLKAIEGFYYTNLPEKISQENLEKLYGDTIQTSISQLENYRRCPFSYYLKYGLRLSDRTELKLERLDTGTLMHHVIDDFFEQLKQEGKNVKDLQDETIETMVKEIIHSRLFLKENYIFHSIPKYVILTKRLEKVIIRAISYIVNTLKRSSFEVLGTEIEFGKGKAYEPIQIKLENNKKVEIIGKIDRIDIAENNKGKYIRIIDYKSSIKNIDLNEVVAGVQIQLLTYLDAVSKKENADLAGVLYFHLIEPVIKTKNKHLTAEEIEQEIRNQFKMNGLLLGNVEVIKMMDHNLTIGNSDMIPAYIDKDGNLSKNKPNILEKEDFVTLQKKVEEVIKQIAEEMVSGEIGQKPIYSLKNKKTACEYCPYQAICGFDNKLCNHSYRYIPHLKKEEIFNQLKEN